MQGSPYRGAIILALGLMTMLVPLRMAHGQDAAARYMAAGERLYESLEYERALAQFAQARRLPRTLAEDVRIALFEGLILSDMGMHEEARAAFKAGLLLEPEAHLPVPTTPQVELEFEGIRAKVRKELAARQPPSQPAPADAPLAEANKTPAASPLETPELVLDPSQTQEASSSWWGSSVRVATVAVPVPSLVLVGAGAVAGGVGGFFGLQSRDQVQAARDASFRDEMVARHGEAVGSARKANILFGAAAVLGTTAIVTWLISGGSDTAGGEAGQ